MLYAIWTNTICLAFKLGVKRPRESGADLCVHQLPALLPLLVAPEEVEDNVAGLLLAAGHLDGGVLFQSDLMSPGCLTENNSNCSSFP